MKKAIALLMIVLLVISMASCTESPSIDETVGKTNDVVGTTGSETDDTSGSTGNTEEPLDATDYSGNAWEAILAGDVYIVEEICRSDGWCMAINAAVEIDNVLDVNTYQYIVKDLEYDSRDRLFNCLFEESRLDFEVIHVQNDVQQIEYWKLKYSDSVGGYYKFSLNYNFNGLYLRDEKILLLSNHDVDLYPFWDNLLESVSNVGFSLDLALEQCEAFIGAIDPDSEYTVSYVLPFGNNGRRQYYWIVYKKVIDGMQITTYQDLKFLVDSNGVQEVGGAVYDLQMGENDVTILSLSEAIDILSKNVELISIKELISLYGDGEDYFTRSLPISKITFEYILGYDKSVIPCWRFYIGSSEDEQNRFGEYILAVDAVSGKIIQERRRHTF